jgi:hypothetical protein
VGQDGEPEDPERVAQLVELGDEGQSDGGAADGGRGSELRPFASMIVEERVDCSV